MRTRLGMGMEPEDVCEDLMMRCLAPDCQMGGLGCDNMTVVLICLLHSGSWREVLDFVVLSFSKWYHAYGF